jgi:hypothetical protein
MQTSPLQLTFGMKPRLPSFPIPEATRISYGEGFIAKWLLMLKKARQIAMDNRVKANKACKQCHDEKAQPMSHPNPFGHKAMPIAYVNLIDVKFQGKIQFPSKSSKACSFLLS